MFSVLVLEVNFKGKYSIFNAHTTTQFQDTAGIGYCVILSCLPTPTQHVFVPSGFLALSLTPIRCMRLSVSRTVIRDLYLQNCLRIQ